MRRHEALEDCLSSQAVSLLVEVLMEAAGNDDSVRGELLRMHRLDCERTQPDPLALAARRARMRRSSRLGGFDDFAQAYADLLGPTVSRLISAR